MPATAHCQYSHKDVLHCCDNFNSLSDEFEAQCSGLGGSHYEGACQNLNLPFLPEGPPGSWRGSCSTIPLKELFDFNDPQGHDHDHESLHKNTRREVARKETSQKLHREGKHDYNIDMKRNEINHHHDHYNHHDFH